MNITACFRPPPHQPPITSDFARAGHPSNLTVILMAMHTRVLELPSRTFFLFGPRGTGSAIPIYSVKK